MIKNESGLLNAHSRFRNFIWVVIAPIILAFVFFWTQARMGFLPTDDGSMLAQAWRIAKGEIPHIDFDSIRPAGSALLHAPFMLLPWGMLAADRLFVTVELIWIAFTSTKLILRNKKVTPEIYFCAVLIVFLINVGTWPIMAWHTIDGLFFAMTSLWLLDKLEIRSRISFIGLGFAWILAGISPLMKQGFILTPLALIVLAYCQQKSKAIMLFPLAGIPLFVYTLWTSPVEFFTQITRSTDILETMIPVFKLLSFAFSVPGLLTLVGALISTITMRSFLAGYSAIIITPLIASLIILPMWSQSLNLVGDWTWTITLFLVVNLVVARQEKELLGLGIALLLIGYSVSLSRGVPGPSLLTGTYFCLSLVILLYIKSTNNIKKNSKNIITFKPFMLIHNFELMLKVVLVLTVIITSTKARMDFIYGEGRRADVTESIEHPQFKFIKMSTRSSAYIKNIIECRSKYPSKVTAVVPDGPGLYPLLGMSNPFSNDWWNKGEIDYFGSGIGERLHYVNVRQTISRLNLETDWLILVQTKPIDEIISPEQVQLTGSSTFTNFPNDANLLDQLIGQEVSCGMLKGKYKPISFTD